MLRLAPAAPVLLLLIAGSVRGQSADTLRRAPTKADSLPAAPAPGFRVGAGPAEPLPGQPAASLSFTTLQPALSRVAGVQVTPYSGAPGSLAVVRIRGAASLARNPQPLYVVDGIPALDEPLQDDFSGTGSTSRTYHDLNPLLALPTEDIESVTVLKGPLETARYGEQGQNGVVEIMTRRGQFGQAPRLRYAAAGGVQQARYRYDLLSARDYAELVNELNLRRNLPAPFSPAEVAALGVGTDWQGELLRPAAVQEHHLSAEAGTATTRGYVGADYLSQTGIVENSHLRRLSLRTNLERQLGARLRLRLGAGLSEVAARQPNATVTADMLVAPPTQAARDANGQFTEPALIFYGNPLRKALQTYEEPRQGRLLSWLAADYEPLKGLHLDLNAGFEQSNLRLSGVAAAMSGQRPGGRVRELEATHRQLTLHPILRLARILAGRHALTARLEAWQQQYRHRAQERTFNGAMLQSESGARSEVALRSYLALAGYVFAGRYEVQGSVRRDGASSLAQASEWLPAAQATWHGRQESFWGANTRINRLDAWVGWGRTSNRGLFHDQKSRNLDPGGSATTENTR